MSVTSVTLSAGTLKVLCDGDNDNVEIHENFPVLVNQTAKTMAQVRTLDSMRHLAVRCALE